MNILVTGGAGFIGSALCRILTDDPSNNVIAFDKLTYAANLGSLREMSLKMNFRLVCGDIRDRAGVLDVLRSESIDRIFHLAAETHVDRSIEDPDVFLETNVIGTARLLAAALEYWRGLPARRRSRFRFHHVSTDEVFGDLPFDNSLFTETTPYAPSSPYSASKASSDHLVHAWHRTYGFPVTVSHCSNNYGPFHHPEKLIPLVITHALEGLPIPVYGSGRNVRDWLYVDDHARALVHIARSAPLGSSYNIGGGCERTNLEVVMALCGILDRLRPRVSGRTYVELVAFVADRPGHDRRYALDTSKIERELHWSAAETFESGLERTVGWYLDNEWWWKSDETSPADEERTLEGIR